MFSKNTILTILSSIPVFCRRHLYFRLSFIDVFICSFVNFVGFDGNAAEKPQQTTSPSIEVTPWTSTAPHLCRLLSWRLLSFTLNVSVSHMGSVQTAELSFIQSSLPLYLSFPLSRPSWDALLLQRRSERESETASLAEHIVLMNFIDAHLKSWLILPLETEADENWSDHGHFITPAAVLFIFPEVFFIIFLKSWWW